MLTGSLISILGYLVINPQLTILSACNVVVMSICVVMDDTGVDCHRAVEGVEDAVGFAAVLVVAFGPQLEFAVELQVADLPALLLTVFVYCLMPEQQLAIPELYFLLLHREEVFNLHGYLR